MIALWLGVAASAGPWAREAGGTYAKLGVSRFRGEADFDASLGVFVGDAVEAYAEVGVGGGIEVDASLRGVVHRAAEQTSAGLQDLELVAAWSPVSAREALSFSVGARVAAYQRGALPELGPGGADVLVGAGYGRSLGPGWVAVDAVLRHRLDTPSAGLDWRAELGLHGRSPVGGAATLELQPAFGRSDLAADDAPAPVPRMFAVGGKLFVDLPAGLGVTADAVWLPSLINDGHGYRLGAGVTWERSPRRP